MFVAFETDYALVQFGPLYMVFCEKARMVRKEGCELLKLLGEMGAHLRVMRK